MRRIQKVISAVYLSALLINTVCLPLSAIFVIFKLCGASAMSWLGCFIPIVVILALSPVTLISKLIIDGKVR